MKSQLEQSPTFAPTQAFVIHFVLWAALDTGHMVGRVEHVVSGKAARFQSLDELVAFMTEVWREVKATSRHPC